MQRLEQIRDLWLERKQQDDVTGNFDHERCHPDTFLVRLRDCGGMPPCWCEIVVNGCFDSAAEALGWLRFVELPRILWWNSGGGGELRDVDSIHPEHYADVAWQPEVLSLVRRLEAAIVAEAVPGAELEAIRGAWNEQFASTDPESELYGLGPVAEVMASGAFDAYLDPDGGWWDDAAKLATILRRGRLDLTKAAHLRLAKDLLELSVEC